MFQGFSQESIDFLWGIRLQNERSWFEANKEIYLQKLAQPLRALGEQVYKTIQESDPQLGLNLHISRIYRDARRLHGRGPYKDHLWFTLRKPTEDGAQAPAFYFEIAPEYFSIGMGCYNPTPTTMAKLRARIDKNSKSIEKLAKQLEQSDFSLEGEFYKRPKGDPGALLFPWYNRKRIIITHDENSDGLLFQPQLAQEIERRFQFLKPYYLYFESLVYDPEP